MPSFCSTDPFLTSKPNESGFPEFSFAPIGLLRLDHQFHIQSANPAATHFLDTSLTELINVPLLNWIHSQSQESFLEYLVQSSAARPHRVLELRFQFKNGETRWGEFSAHRVTTTELGLQYYCTLSDITARKYAADSANRQRAFILNSSKRLSLMKMAKGIAHQLNNPLSILQLRAELLRRVSRSTPTAPGELEKIADGIEATIHRMAKIINSLVQLGQTGRPSEFKSVPVASLVEQALDLFQAKLDSGSIRVQVETPAPTEELLCQPSRVTEILTSLLDNAYDSVAALPGEKWIKIAATCRAERVEFAVTDSGPGMSVTDLDRLFEPFFTTKGPQGSLGLSLCVGRAYAEANGGSLDLDRTSRWTRFVLHLPKQVH